jgi:redox-sensitive bicupin YhaK (pirin superfamily)
MTKTKRIGEIFKTQRVTEGAGVKLRRGFGNVEVPRFDPFLLFDDFSGGEPADYMAGFPWHPHRGIETVTYILDGSVRHRDSMGNEGAIEKGELQWMSAGSGIIHEEMPESASGIKGFQLWVNLPRESKMSAPRYQDVKKKTVPEIGLSGGGRIKVIAGDVGTAKGPVDDIAASPLYVDVTLTARERFTFPVIAGNTTFVYLYEGELGTGMEGSIIFERGTILLYAREGESVELEAGSSGAKFLLVSGKPLNEPVAWYGPIVMNTQDELRTAFRELEEGVFVKGS